MASAFTKLLAADIGFMTAEAETTYGTDPNDSPVFLIIREQPDVSELINQIERTRLKSSVGGDPNAVHKVAIEGSFQTVLGELTFSDSATPATAPIWKSSGFKETTSGSTSSPPVTAKYELKPRDFGSVTYKFYIPDKNSTTDYTQIIVSGARSIPTLTYGMGDEVLLDVEFKGLYGQWSTIQDFSGDEPGQLHKTNSIYTTPNQSFSFGSVNTDISNFELSTAFSFQDLNSATASEMLKEAALQKDGKHSGSIDPYATSVGSGGDPKDLMRKEQQAPMNLTIENPGATRRTTFTAPRAEVTEAPMEESNGHFRYGVSYQLNETGVGKDDDFTLTWEADS
jgi:hypothetical protein